MCTSKNLSGYNEKYSKAIDLYVMVIGNLGQRTLSIHLIAMYMTVIRMVVDA